MSDERSLEALQNKGFHNNFDLQNKGFHNNFDLRL